MVTQRDSRQVPPTLAELRAAVDEAREAVATARGLNFRCGDLVASQRLLLSALENFIRALNAAGCPSQGYLRVEADLLRGLTGSANRRTTRRLDGSGGEIPRPVREGNPGT
jgi:hypothetical protein